MSFVSPSSERAQEVLGCLEPLQRHFADGLNRLSVKDGDGRKLKPTRWLRDEGCHGGGHRLECTATALLNRCSLNISTIHYDDLPQKRLSSATALSCIVHPHNPAAPSMHMHISWTELRGQEGGWRLMADLNPSMPDTTQTRRFNDALSAIFVETPQGTLDKALAQGDRYFSIPALNRRRGVVHAYLEQWRTDDPAADLRLAERFGRRIVDAYLLLVADALKTTAVPDVASFETQLAYHTLYLFQVLTLDRGTSSGLLVHQQNDGGILGSLPNRVDPLLLASWRASMPSPQELLLDRILEVLPPLSPATLTPAIRLKLAQAVRAHYKAHPEALSLQARGDVLPPTVANHTETA